MYYKIKGIHFLFSMVSLEIKGSGNPNRNLERTRLACATVARLLISEAVFKGNEVLVEGARNYFIYNSALISFRQLNPMKQRRLIMKGRVRGNKADGKEALRRFEMARRIAENCSPAKLKARIRSEHRELNRIALEFCSLNYLLLPW